MSGVVDVGDAIELTFNTVTGADVYTWWLDPDLAPVIDEVSVTEDPAGSGEFPYTFLPTLGGMWTARFTASGTATADERYYVRAVAAPAVPPLAAIGDVSGQFGALTTAQESLTGWLLRVASKRVRARYPQIDTQIAAGTLDPDVVALGVAHMVLRVLRNPRGLRSETIGPFSRTYDTSHAAGLLTITDEEAAMFTPLATIIRPSSIGSSALKPGLAPPSGWARHGSWGW